MKTGERREGGKEKEIAARNSNRDSNIVIAAAAAGMWTILLNFSLDTSKCATPTHSTAAHPLLPTSHFRANLSARLLRSC